MAPSRSSNTREEFSWLCCDKIVVCSIAEKKQGREGTRKDRKDGGREKGRRGGERGIEEAKDAEREKLRKNNCGVIN